MAQENTEFGRIDRRERDLNEWLRKTAPESFSEQKHCEEGTQERAYWHYGYMVALRDVMRLMRGDSTRDTPGISGSIPSA